jgi:hypothetical protein
VLYLCCNILAWFYPRFVPCSDILIFLPFCFIMHLFCRNIVLYQARFLCCFTFVLQRVSLPLC